MAELMAVSVPGGLDVALASWRRSRLAIMALAAMSLPRVFGRSLRAERDAHEALKVFCTGTGAHATQ
eukprot:4853481-Prymnesium_polylepis.1